VRICFAIIALAVFPALAQNYPQPSEGDPQIQTVQYDPARIIRLSVAPGLQTMVELAAGETIQTIGVGDSSAWQVTAGKRGDFFFIKNVSASAMTNMTVVTAGRVYNFELTPAGSGYGAVSAYQVRLLYPGRSPMVATVDSGRAYEYRVSGSRAIRPSSVYQEGMRTIVEWPDETALPAIFALENGHEALVNGEMQDGRFVIAGSPAKLVFRLDRKTAYATRKILKEKPSE
jgi:type IV secretion system protein VirB9